MAHQEMAHNAEKDGGIDPRQSFSGEVTGCRSFLGERFTYHAEPVDATEVPAEMTGLRTMFQAFHHLRPEQARTLRAQRAGMLLSRHIPLPGSGRPFPSAPAQAAHSFGIPIR
jgi:hypothetical protein